MLYRRHIGVVFHLVTSFWLWVLSGPDNDPQNSSTVSCKNSYNSGIQLFQSHDSKFSCTITNNHALDGIYIAHVCVIQLNVTFDGISVISWQIYCCHNWMLYRRHIDPAGNGTHDLTHTTALYAGGIYIASICKDNAYFEVFGSVLWFLNIFSG